MVPSCKKNKQGRLVGNRRCAVTRLVVILVFDFPFQIYIGQRCAPALTDSLSVFEDSEAEFERSKEQVASLASKHLANA